MYIDYMKEDSRHKVEGVADVVDDCIAYDEENLYYIILYYIIDYIIDYIILYYIDYIVYRLYCI